MVWCLNYNIILSVIILQVPARLTGRHHLHRRVKLSTRPTMTTSKSVRCCRLAVRAWTLRRRSLSRRRGHKDVGRRDGTRTCSSRVKPAERATPVTMRRTGTTTWLILLYLVMFNIKYTHVFLDTFIHALHVYNPHVFIICTCTTRLGVVSTWSCLP